MQKMDEKEGVLVGRREEARSDRSAQQEKWLELLRDVDVREMIGRPQDWRINLGCSTLLLQYRRQSGQNHLGKKSENNTRGRAR